MKQILKPPRMGPDWLMTSYKIIQCVQGVCSEVASLWNWISGEF